MLAIPNCWQYAFKSAKLNEFGENESSILAGKKQLDKSVLNQDEKNRSELLDIPISWRYGFKLANLSEVN